MPRRPNGYPTQLSTPPSSSDSSTSTSEDSDLTAQSEDRRSTGSLSLPEDLLDLLNSANVEVYGILEEVRRLRELRDIATSQSQDLTRDAEREDPDSPVGGDPRSSVGPSHSAIDLTPPINTSEIDQLSNIVDDLLARNPASWFPQH